SHPCLSIGWKQGTRRGAELPGVSAKDGSGSNLKVSLSILPVNLNGISWRYCMSAKGGACVWPMSKCLIFREGGGGSVVKRVLGEFLASSWPRLGRLRRARPCRPCPSRDQSALKSNTP